MINKLIQQGYPPYQKNELRAPRVHGVAQPAYKWENQLAVIGSSLVPISYHRKRLPLARQIP